jgi:hypothetical protein
MATMLAVYTTEKQRSVVHFSWAQGLNAKDIHKEMFPVYGGKCLSRKAVHNWVENLKDIRKSQMMPEQVRKWLRQQSKDFYAVGFRRTSKAMGQVYQCWWRICREKNAFFFRFEYHKFYI